MLVTRPKLENGPDPRIDFTLENKHPENNVALDFTKTVYFPLFCLQNPFKKNQKDFPTLLP